MSRIIKITLIIFLFTLLFCCNNEEKRTSKKKAGEVFRGKIAESKPVQPIKIVQPVVKEPDKKPATTTVPIAAVKEPDKKPATTTVPIAAVKEPDKKSATTEIAKEIFQNKDVKQKDTDNKVNSQFVYLFQPNYHYTSDGKIDPFSPLLKKQEKSVTPEENKKKEKRVPLTPIEMVDLIQLKLSAIIQSPSGKNIALVEEATGKGYTIQKGTYIGIHSGQVTEIKKDTIVVEEEVEDIFGNVKKQKRELKLQKPAGEE